MTTLDFVLAWLAVASAVILLLGFIGFVQAQVHRLWWQRHGRAEIDRLTRLAREANEKEWRH